MSGCFGGSAEDRYMERQLDEWLDGLEPPTACQGCEHVNDCEWTPDVCRTGALEEEITREYERDE